jgi:hypothetical protein
MKNEDRLGEFLEAMRKALGELIGRCEKAGIEYEWEEGIAERYFLSLFVSFSALVSP